MNTVYTSRRQRGVITIFICMVMLILITVLVTTAFSLSTMNLRAVGNAQVREEAIAAANLYIEQTVASPFTENPAAAAVTDFPIDINGDTVPDYLVDLAVPICVRSTRAIVNTSSSVTLPGMTAVGAWNTIWELNATATDTTTGARVQVLHGVRVLLSQIDKDARCA